MKRFLLLIILMAAIVGAVLYYQDLHVVLERWINFSFCDKPVSYRLGTIDPKFEKTQPEVLESVRQAGDVWNDIAGRPLFTYDPQAALVINLVFDERQSTLKELNQKRDVVDEELENLDANVDTFAQDRKELEEKLAALNQDIGYWNERGGAPDDIYNKLIARQEELRQEIERINRMADRLNMASEKINQNIGTVNEEVQKFNSLLSIKPEEGVYMPGTNTIEIYIYDSDEGFVHTVAHELGHALGLDHVDEKDSIMHPVSSPRSHATLSDQKLLVDYCEKQNRLELVSNDLKNFWHILLVEMGYVIT